MPARRAASADPTLDLSHLTDAEKRQLVQVLQRDGELQEAERMRIVKLKSFVRQEDRSAEALLQRSEFNERYCIRCYRRFLLLFNPWVCCCLCSLRMCRGRCAQRSREFSGGFVCRVCDRSRVCLTGQCPWFYEAVKKKFRNSGSAKVTLSLSRDAQQFAEACQSAAPSQPLGLAIEQMFNGRAVRQGSLDSDGARGGAASRQVQQQPQLTDSGHGGSLGTRRGIYRTELTFATMADCDADSAAAFSSVAAAAAAAEGSAGSTVGLHVTAFQGQLHDVLRRLQAELRARVSDEREASAGEGKEVANRYGREIADLISAFAQTLHATLASRDGSPCSVEARLQRVQRVVQQEVENAIGLSVDRVVQHPGTATTASAVAAAASPGSDDDGQDSGLELEGRLADFVVQKVLDDHLVALEEEAAAEAAAAARRSSPVTAAEPADPAAEHFLGYRPLPSSLTSGGRWQSALQQPQQPHEAQHPSQHSTMQPDAPADSPQRGQQPRGPLVTPPRQVAETAATSVSDVSHGGQLDRHIDELFAFDSSDGAGRQIPSSTPKQRRSRDAAAVSRRSSDRLPAKPPQPSQPLQPQRSDLRLGRFAPRIAHDSYSGGEDDDDDGSDSCDSWDKAPPVLTLTVEAAAPLVLSFGRIDWAQNERTDPRFCAKPEAAVAAPRGERVTFRTVVDGTEPIEVLWHRLKSGTAYEICNSDKYELTSDPDGDRSHNLTIYHTVDSDAGAYLVIAANEERAVMHGFKLQVVDNPQPSKAPAFTEPMSDTRAREGRTARFRCRVAGQPAPRVTFLRDGAPVRPDGAKYHVVNTSNGSYELQINDVTKSDDAEYSCLATNASGSTQCDCQLLVYRLAEEDEALRRIEGEIQQTQASMITAAKDMYRASGKIRQLDANFGRLNQRLSSMERQLVSVGSAYPESGALQRITGHMLRRLADHEATAGASAAPACAESTTESSFDAPVSDWSLASASADGGDVSLGGGSGGFSSFESVPQTSSCSKIVYEIENVGDDLDGAEGGVDSDELASTERQIYVAASKNSLLRQKLEELERRIASGDGAFDADSMEKALANLQLLATQSDAEVGSIEAAANQLADRSGPGLDS